jgi:hypothetical protein
MTFESTRSNGDWLTGVVGAGPSAGLLRFCFVLLHAHTLAIAMIASETTIRFELSILIYANLNSRPNLSEACSISRRSTCRASLAAG